MKLRSSGCGKHLHPLSHLIGFIDFYFIYLFIEKGLLCNPSCLRFPNAGITATIPDSAVKCICVYVWVSEDNLKCHTAPVHLETFRCCCPLPASRASPPPLLLPQEQGFHMGLGSQTQDLTLLWHTPYPLSWIPSTSPIASPRSLSHTWSWVSVRGHPEPAFTDTKITTGQMVHSPCPTTTCP